MCRYAHPATGSETIAAYTFGAVIKTCQTGSMSKAIWGQNLNIAWPVLRRLEVVRPYEPLIDQHPHTEVYCPEANAQLIGYFALLGIGFTFKQAQGTKTHMFSILSPTMKFTDTNRKMATARRGNLRPP